MSTSSNISRSHDPEQPDLKDIMKTELIGATYEEDDFIAKWFPNIDPQSHQALVSELQDAGLSPTELGFQPHPFDRSKPLKRWPTGNSEPDYYEPFTWLLNSILALEKERLQGVKGPGSNTGMQGQGDLGARQPIHYALQFYPYDRIVKEDVDGFHALKPDGIGVKVSVN